MKRLYYNYVKWKNYQWSGVYHITLVTNHRGTNLFGSIAGNTPADAHVSYTELGRAIQTCILDIPAHHPQEKIVIEAATVMPDHIHFVLHVVRDLHTTTFGKIINGLKIGINQASRSIAQPNRNAVGTNAQPNRTAVGTNAQPNRTAVGTNAQPNRTAVDIPQLSWQDREQLRGTGLMQQGFNCRILLPNASLSTMVDYVNDNPRRAWIKKHNRDLFTIKRDLHIAQPNRNAVGTNAQPNRNAVGTNAQPNRTAVDTMQFSALGNLFLLDYPCRQVVECSRTIPADRLAAQLADIMAKAEQGAVTYTAAINDGERAIAKSVREAGYPLVVLLKDGFPPVGSENEKYYKPGGVYFDACAEGRLLLLEPTQATFTDPTVIHLTETDLRHKAEMKHYSWSPIPFDSLRYRYVALNNIAHLLCNA